MNIEEMKKRVLRLSDNALIDERASIIDKLLSGDVDADTDPDGYKNYWAHDWSVLQEQLKIIEIELCYRHIDLSIF